MINEDEGELDVDEDNEANGVENDLISPMIPMRPLTSPPPSPSKAREKLMSALAMDVTTNSSLSRPGTSG